MNEQSTSLPRAAWPPQVIAQSLHHIAQEEVPEDMNLLPEVQARLGSMTRRSKVTRGLSLLMTLVVMLGAAMGVYALVYRQATGDPGIEGARAADLVTDVNQSQTIDGVTVTIDWVYVDASRMALGYSITAPQGQEGTQYLTDMHLSDEANSFGMMGGGGGGGGGSDTTRESQYSFSTGVQFNADAPSTLAMHLTLSVAPVPAQVPTGDQNGVGGAGGGGGGGGGGGFGYGGGDPNATPEPGIHILSGDPGNPSAWIGPFEFAFSLPYYPALDLTFDDQSQTFNEVTITVDHMRVTPSATDVHLCYDLPDARDWMPVMTITTGEVTVPMTSWSGDEIPAPDAVTRCGTLTFYVPYTLTPTTFTVTVDGLEAVVGRTPERVEQFRQQLADQDIVIEITQADEEGFGYNLVSVPDGVDVGALVQAAYAVFSDHFEGRWEFSVDVPGME
ncbi:MAG: DUF4179 domain-containing protein [Anaerolineae bacterium]